MFSFIMSFLKSKPLYILIIVLVLALTFFYLKNETLNAKLEKEKLTSSLWKESSESSQITIDSLLAHQKASNKAMLELATIKTKLRDTTDLKKRKLQENIKSDIKTKDWAENEIPKNIQKLLADTN